MNCKIRQEIYALKKQDNAIILAHYYQRPEIQEVADFIGDSLELARKAMNVKEEIIVFCGVRFMAETVKILSPNKKIILPVSTAGCPMADMVIVETLRKKKKKYPNAAVVCYINSTAEVKAESDICCTSSNAVQVVKKISAEQILFVPDKNLGSYVAKQVPEKKIILWDGYCNTHNRIQKEEIMRIKEMKPWVKILVHPECKSEVILLADYVGSTGQMISYAEKSEATEFLIGTEQGILTQIRKKNSNKKFEALSSKLICGNMKKTYIHDVRDALITHKYAVEVEENIRNKAYVVLQRMFE